MNVDGTNYYPNYYPPKKIRKNLKAFKVLFIIGLVLIISIPFSYLSHNIILFCFSSFGYLIYGIAFILSLTILYRSWKVIQDGNARTTPGRAVGFIFIPIFDIYWIFVVIWGLTKDMKQYAKNRSIRDVKINSGLALTYCILSLIINLASIPVALFISPSITIFFSIGISVPLMIMFYVIIKQVSLGAIAICKWKEDINSSKTVKTSITQQPRESEYDPSQSTNKPIIPHRPPRTMDKQSIEKSKKISISKEYRKLLAGVDPKKVSSPIVDTIPNYAISHKIGSGGFATIYKANDINGQEVALKLPRFLDETVDVSILRKFETESNIWNKVKHKNIVKFFDSNIRPVPFIVMEYVQGGNLTQLMKSYYLSIGEVADIMLQVLDGLSYAHRMGIIHRDIKPENILFTEHGIPKISDWGIGKYMSSSAVSKTVGIKGTVSYSTPEQLNRRKYGKPDWQTDIFQVGIVFYEMLTGKNPFLEEEMAGTMNSILSYQPDPPSTINPDIPPKLDKIVMKALEKQKQDRWRSADVMYDRLKDLVA